MLDWKVISNWPSKVNLNSVPFMVGMFSKIVGVHGECRITKK
jgi:hypothetical protein